MPRYEFVCHDCKKLFSKILSLVDYEEGERGSHRIHPCAGADSVDQLKSCRAGCSRSPCTKFDNKNSGASGEIRTLKHLFLRQAAIPIRTRWHSGAQGRI